MLYGMHAAAVVLLRMSSYLTAGLTLLLCVNVDGGLIDACECVVPWIVPERMRYTYSCQHGHTRCNSQR